MWGLQKKRCYIHQIGVARWTISEFATPTWYTTISNQTKSYKLWTVRLSSIHHLYRSQQSPYLWRTKSLTKKNCFSLNTEQNYRIMAKHHPDLIFCRKQPGVGKHFRSGSTHEIESMSLSSFYHFCFVSFLAIGRLCEKCDGKCVICDSYVRPCTLVRICDECNYGSYQGRCVICGGPGVSDAYYCKECTIQEKDVTNTNQYLVARA